MKAGVWELDILQKKKPSLYGRVSVYVSEVGWSAEESGFLRAGRARRLGAGFAGSEPAVGGISGVVAGSSSTRGEAVPLASGTAVVSEACGSLAGFRRLGRLGFLFSDLAAVAFAGLREVLAAFTCAAVRRLGGEGASASGVFAKSAPPVSLDGKALSPAVFSVFSVTISTYEVSVSGALGGNSGSVTGKIGSADSLLETETISAATSANEAASKAAFLRPLRLAPPRERRFFL